MKPQVKSSGNPSAGQMCCSAAVRRDLQAAYRRLDQDLGRQPWLLQGSLNRIAPKSAAGRVTYSWTRKVRAKTVTIALSREQATAVYQAIAANRRIKATLSRLYTVSQTALLVLLPGVTKRRFDEPNIHQPKSS